MAEQSIFTISERLNEILAQLNSQGGFPLSVLSDLQGLPLASDAVDSEDPEAQAAVVSLIQTAIEQTSLIDSHEQDEFSLRMRAGRRLVCRLFTAGQRRLLLALVVPKGRYYRRLTSRAMKDIQLEWTQE